GASLGTQSFRRRPAGSPDVVRLDSRQRWRSRVAASAPSDVQLRAAGTESLLSGEPPFLVGDDAGPWRSASPVAASTEHRCLARRRGGSRRARGSDRSGRVAPGRRTSPLRTLQGIAGATGEELA